MAFDARFTAAVEVPTTLDDSFTVWVFSSAAIFAAKIVVAKYYIYSLLANGDKIQNGSTIMGTKKNDSKILRY